jgi:hypothetical protein
MDDDGPVISKPGNSKPHGVRQALDISAVTGHLVRRRLPVDETKTSHGANVPPTGRSPPSVRAARARLVDTIYGLETVPGDVILYVMRTVTLWGHSEP